MANSVIEDYVTLDSEDKKPPSTDVPDIESKPESLTILATLGTSKEWIGENLPLGDVKKLLEKDIFILVEVSIYFGRNEPQVISRIQSLM